jgi:heme iron utilization protein
MAANQERNYCREAALLLTRVRSGTLATLHGGMPYASLVTPAFGGAAAPLLLLSDLAAHTRNLRVNPACSLLVTGAPVDENPQTAPRVLLSGTAAQTDDAAAQQEFLRIHFYANLYSGLTDFHLWRMDVQEVHYVGGFAAAARLKVVALQHEIKSIIAAEPG